MTTEGGATLGLGEAAPEHGSHRFSHAAMATVFRQRIESAELDDSDLTLRDLRRIRDAFASTLRSLYHPRVAYPNESHTSALETVPERVVH